jgi:adenosylcobinamide kinase/adenosylcobinamide-phosphate guanylyltransferase
MIFVTNEVGWGTVSENALTRRYMDELGNLNQALAKICDEVILMVSGIPAQIKGVHSARLGS